MKERRIGVVGGTFNPIHYAHLLMGECAREQFALDRVIFIPSGVSYMKRDQDIPSGEIRYQMVKLATQDNPYFTCSRIEIDREGNTYTADTLAELHRMYPGDELYFIVGADSLKYMDQWVRPEEIFAQAVVLAAVRNEVDEEELGEHIRRLKDKFGADIRPLSFHRIDVSSSDIREKFRNGKSVRYYMPDACIEFARLKNLYSAVDDTSEPMDEDADMKFR